MKTLNYAMDLMVPMQNNKEIIFNEGLSKIDEFLNSTVTAFIDSLPQQLSVGTRYILSGGDKARQICYCLNLTKGWQFHQPRDGMIIFIYKENAFYIFQDNEWEKINMASITTTTNNNAAVEAERFIGVEENFELPNKKDYIYLYMSGDCIINTNNIKNKQCTILLKQNYRQTFKIEWAKNILWPNRVPHQITSHLNGIDVVKLHPLIETNHWLGEIVSQNYQF